MPRKKFLTLKVEGVSDETLCILVKMIEGSFVNKDGVKHPTSGKIMLPDDYGGLPWFILDWKWIREDYELDEVALLAKRLGLSEKESATADLLWIHLES